MIRINNNWAQSGGGINVIGLATGGTDDSELVRQGKSVLTMNGGIVSNNHAMLNAGGISASQTKLDLNGVSIKNNDAYSSGGGMVISYGDDVTLTDVTISENRANAIYGIGAGGVELLNSNIKLVHTTVTGNTSKGLGGGLFLSTTANGTTSVEMTDGSVVDGNTGWKDTFSEQDNDVLILAFDGTSTISGDTTVQKDGQAFVGWRSATPGLSDQAPEYTPDGKDPWVYLSSKWHSHTPGEAVRENVVPAQVGVAGSYEEVVYCSECNEELSRDTHTIDALPTPPVAVVPGDDVVVDEDPGTEIDDPAVPLASGPVTRAQFIDYLWRHEGEPASDGACAFTDVPEDHEYVLALAWAEQNGVAVAYDDGSFEPDELVTVAAVREFLGSFADVFGEQAVAAANLKSLTGADDEAVLNCDEVLAEFFGE